MHVRRLYLQGFKTFASKTAFEFHRGITAIVGPNGSGKSNLADALRWVLGEQSYSTLRSRRTEDVIFSGSSARPPLGMAEVTLVLDNEDGSLPVEFPEVEITRRAYRSGVNEYFLNRRRVRLQDIEEVLGGLTSSYVVIHQGLVDEALALRPRERRLLLEEAAEVRRYHERREKSLERLRQTEANMVRISDLRAELVPRLRLLERQSQQARERNAVESSLVQALRHWYRLLWEEASRALALALEQQHQACRELEQRQSALAAALERTTRLRQSLQEAQRHAEEQRRREAELRHREAAIRQELARAEGEMRALQRYQQELRKQVERWERESRQQAQRRHRLGQERTALAQQVEQDQAALQEREQALRQAEDDLRTLEQKHRQLQQQAQAVAGHIAQVERRLEYLATRAEALAREETDRSSFLRSLAERQQQAEREKARVEAELADLAAACAAQEAESDRLHAALSAAQEEVRRAEAGLEQARLRLAESRARQSALEQAAAGDGAAFLRQWAEEQGRPIATLLSVLNVPAGLETAVEAALEVHATALLLSDWQEAQSALEALLAAEAGRATLLPRLQVRPPAVPLPAPLPSGCEGLLLDHLTCPEGERAALDSLLGQTLLARDLRSARSIAAALPAGWSVVTRRGEVVTATGVLRGGRWPTRRGAVALERERRELEQAVAEATAARARYEQALQEAQGRLARLQQELAVLQQGEEERRVRREALSRRARELAHDQARMEEEIALHQGRLAALGEERAALEREQAALDASRRQLQDEQKDIQARLDRSEQDMQAARGHHERARDIWQESRTAWLVAQKEAENRRALEEMARRSADRLQEQIADGTRRLNESLAQQKGWEARMACLQAEVESLAASAASFAASIPAPAALDELAHAEEEAASLRQAVLEQERLVDQAAMEVERQRDRLKEVLRRGLGELGPEASAYGSAGEALLGALIEDPPEWARVPLPSELSMGEAERRVAQLREEVRRIGPVNPLAEEEYRETRERYEFLGQQLQDLHDASRSLQQVIAELDRAMAERFHDTFEAINREFQAYFARLFGGGTASLRLVRLDEEQDGGLAGLGVEIIARPPGKRAHTLALLSGGERALTSSALLFAILKVNPRPFCLLDEVDAMLDEANVGRFRECLEELAAQTQFIVITHNRGTVEAAQTLYGVSMADDGTSKVLSLRLDDVAV